MGVEGGAVSVGDDVGNVANNDELVEVQWGGDILDVHGVENASILL